MLVTTADRWFPESGDVLTWEVDSPAGGVPARLSFNQRNHLAAAAAGEPSVWLMLAFDVAGRVDAHALEAAFRDFVARHETLHCTAVRDRDGGIVSMRHDPAAFTWSRAAPEPAGDGGTTRSLIRAALDRQCRPFRGPAFLPAAISRPTTSTIVIGFDHLHADAHSLTIAAAELPALYAARVQGGTTIDLPPASSSVGQDVAAVPFDDPRLRSWQEFLAAQGHGMPTFPLPLGLAAGEQAVQATRVEPLLDRGATEQLGAVAGHAGVSTFAAVLDCFGAAVRELGGPARLPLLLPVSTRRERDTWSFGWMTTTVPITLTDGEGLAGTGASLRAALALADVPLDQMIASLSSPLTRTRRDVFMVSWLDYRRLPAHAEAAARRAHHVSSPTVADDVQIWLSRTETGVAIRVRHPDTEAAHESVELVIARWRKELRERSGPELTARVGDP